MALCSIPRIRNKSLWGDVIHVNGQPYRYYLWYKDELRKYRLRWLFYTYLGTLQDDLGKALTFQVIGADTGLMTKPVQSTNLKISMVERCEIVVDFSGYHRYASNNITVKNAREVQTDNDYSSTDKVTRFVVRSKVTSNAGNGSLPISVRNVPFPSMKNGVGRSVKIISRTKGKRGMLPYEKEALENAVLLCRNEVVRVISGYASLDGVYMFHCHNLINEYQDMMTAFNVNSLENGHCSETTHFTDPMKQKYRSRDTSAKDDPRESSTRSAKTSKL
ncbi:hypothetical protein T440DRAFT_518125 [Plenodomus tracheiphilus IPT5]|uniref:Plastocyanin-like domain-containing protein n=1 Tax=Plenodomus tracheiphilus IPT5 TaxID=1408161 RepID=A0A6A7B9G7_9PLEO|nr:hypothetical protein T440DRAFT_518125 [Plenodomus tracheiphilus IPT5]